MTWRYGLCHILHRFFSRLQLYLSFICSSFYIRRIETVLRKFDHGDLMLREFGENTPLISELSSYLREPAIKYTTECHAFERIQYLQKFPLIKQIYVKFNCISPTEADVERVFSFAGSFILDFKLNHCVVPWMFCHSIFIKFWYWVCCIMYFSVQLSAHSVYLQNSISKWISIVFIFNRFDFAAESSAHVRWAIRDIASIEMQWRKVHVRHC